MDMATPTPIPWNWGLTPLLFAELQKTTGLLLRRPLWILPEPQALTMSGDRPVYQGVLELVDGPERIESGWWDDDGITRDYYIAMNTSGVHLWIYRNRNKTNTWFLHGIFG